MHRSFPWGPVPTRSLVTVTLTLLFALIGGASAQRCHSEADGYVVRADAVCVAGALAGGDRDDYDLVFDEEAVTVRLLFALRSEVAVEVELRRSGEEAALLTLSAEVSVEPILLSAGSYTLSVASSPDADLQRYSVDFGAISERPPPLMDREPNDDADAATTLGTVFQLQGDLVGSADVYHWVVGEEDAASMIRFSGSVEAGAHVEVQLLSATGEEIARLASGGDGRFALGPRTFAAGTYSLILGPAAARPTRYWLSAASLGTELAGVEVEPNDTTAGANFWDISGPLDATIDGGDADLFAVELAETGSYRLGLAGGNGFEEVVQAAICLLDAAGQTVWCQPPREAGHLLELPAGRSFVRLQGRSADVARYSLSLVVSDPPATGHEAEPNDRPADANAMGADLRIRGDFGDRDVDHHRFSIGGSERVRIQIVGDGMQRLQVINGGQIRVAVADLRNRQRGRLDNLLLVPGDYTLVVEGSEGGRYAIQVLSLGAAEPEATGGS